MQANAGNSLPARAMGSFADAAMTWLLLLPAIPAARLPMTAHQCGSMPGLLHPRQPIAPLLG